MLRLRITLIGMLMIILSAPLALAGGTFTPLPLTDAYFPGPLFTNHNGTVISGQWGGPFYYTPAEGVVHIDDGTQGILRGGYISGDGTTIATTSEDINEVQHASYWNAAGFTTIPSFAGSVPCDAFYSTCYAVSYDGSAATGLQWVAGCNATAFKWTNTGGMVDLGNSGDGSRGNDISDDASTVVGFDSDPVLGHRRAAIWTDAVSGPQIIVPGESTSEAYAVSSDGSKVCGSWEKNAMYWDAAVGAISLGSLPGDENFITLGNSISDDGKIVGTSGDRFNATPRAFIWTPSDGLMYLPDYLDAQGVTGHEGLHLYTGSGISADGNTIVGSFINPSTGLKDAFVVRLTSTSGVGDGPRDTPVAAARLLGAYPNPFNPMTSVKFSLEHDQHVSLSVYDLSGRRVAELADQVFSAGEHSVVWRGRDSAGREVSTGNYMLKMKTGKSVQTSKMMLVK